MSDKLNNSAPATNTTTNIKGSDNTPDPGDCCSVPPPTEPPTT